MIAPLGFSILDGKAIHRQVRRGIGRNYCHSAVRILPVDNRQVIRRIWGTPILPVISPVYCDVLVNDADHLIDHPKITWVDRGAKSIDSFRHQYHVT